MPNEVVPWIPVIASLGGVLVGSVGAVIGGLIGQWMGLKREREAREHEAEMSRMRQWSDFQVKTLVELQDALDKVSRAAFHVANISGQVANGKMPMETAIKSEASFHIVRNQALKLTARVDDEGVRLLAGDLCALVEQIKQLGIRFNVDRHYDVDALNSMYADARGRFAATNDRIGQVIRGSQRPRLEAISVGDK